MLEHTFCHIPGIGKGTERKLWDAGILSWQDVADGAAAKLPPKRRQLLETHVQESITKLADRDARYFYDLLPTDQHWRLFHDFRDSIAYFDIETTGLNGDYDYMTSVALYDGQSIRHYVRGKNMRDFQRDIKDYGLVVTYNGKTFDVPFVCRHLQMQMGHAHIDLRYVLSSLGYTGGLKKCERSFGLERNDLADVDGYFAVLLWHDYKSGNELALDTLLAYNIADAINLQTLMFAAHNLKLKDTPFESDYQLEVPKLPAIPFKADMKTIRMIQMRHGW
jgi:uncharacterized protein YprB with RNaseH-like and TPR domain